MDVLRYHKHEAPNEEIDEQVKILNELQIIKRIRSFSSSEIEKLYKISCKLLINKKTEQIHLTIKGIVLFMF